MCPTSLIRWINQKFSNGIFNGPFANAVAWCDNHLSLNRYLKDFVRARLAIQNDQKNPRWVSELYVCVFLCIGIVFVLIPPFVPRWLATVIACFALYRPFEIIIFAVRWIFLATDAIHSYKRSLSGFIMNIAEVVIFFAAAYLGFGLVKGTSSVPTASYSSLRTTVTIGPTATLEPLDCWFAGVLISLQIAISYFLIIIVVASVVGTLRRREVEGRLRREMM